MKEEIEELIKKLTWQPIRVPVDKRELDDVIETLIPLMFPFCDFGEELVIHEKLLATARRLHAIIGALTGKEKADEIVESFFRKFQLLRERLNKDAHNFLKSDPAAKSLEEVIFAYPGFYALCVYRAAHEIHLLGAPFIARLFSEYAHSKVGIDLHPAATIGKNLFMDHGTGIVIGETTEIGNNVKIYQGVTLGALYVEKKLSDVKRHPTVEDNVVIYANATVLGGNTVIGHDSVIGAGAWLTRSVPPYSLVYNSVDVKVRTKKDTDRPNNF